MPDTLDEVVHQRTRLGILTVVQEAKTVTFGFLKETLSLTDGNLSRHLRVLEDAGHVKIDKTFVGRRPQTNISTTPKGRKALAHHLAVLQEMINRVKGES